VTIGTAGEIEGAPDPGLGVFALCGRFRDFAGAYLAPDIPPGVVAGAFQCYLGLRDDETLLAIVSAGKKDPPGSGCALTTRRIYWPGKRDPADDAGDPAPDSRPPLCRSIAYADLPGSFTRTGSLVKAVDLGGGRKVVLGGNVPLQDVLIGFLRDARRVVRGEGGATATPGDDPGRAARAWPGVVAASPAFRAFRVQIGTLHRTLFRTSRVVVTPILAVACVAVYGAMILAGASPITPDNQLMINWGANFGPSVVFDHQYWRLLSCMFLHFGAIHLALNLWCLVSAGPTVERIFGNLGFAALYVLSGLGGSVAGLWTHPATIGAGASGAVFGIFGGLLGFVAVRRRDVPAAILRPMRSGAVTFVVLNLAIGLSDSRIDMSAHLGGLATGFVVGLMMVAASPSGSGAAGTARRSGVVVASAVALALLAAGGIGRGGARMLADPRIGPLLRGQAAGEEWNEFSRAMKPALAEFDAINIKLAGVAQALMRDDPPDPAGGRALDDLAARVEALEGRLGAVPTRNGEVRAMRDRLGLARAHLGDSLSALKRYREGGRDVHSRENDTFVKSMRACDDDFTGYATLRDAYFKAHGLISRSP